MPFTKKIILHRICFLVGITIIFLGITACDDSPTVSKPQTRVVVRCRYGESFDSVRASFSYKLAGYPSGYVQVQTKYIIGCDSVYFSIDPSDFYSLTCYGFYRGASRDLTFGDIDIIYNALAKKYVYDVFPDTVVMTIE